MIILTNEYAGESRYSQNYAQAIFREYSGGMSETVKLSTLSPDMRNANLGTPRGSQMIEDSLRQYGAGRSILLACEKTGRKCYMMELSPQRIAM